MLYEDVAFPHLSRFFVEHNLERVLVLSVAALHSLFSFPHLQFILCNPVCNPVCTVVRSLSSAAGGGIGISQLLISSTI